MFALSGYFLTRMCSGLPPIFGVTDFGPLNPGFAGCPGFGFGCFAIP